MRNYKVSVEATLSLAFEVEAEDAEAAEKIVRDRIASGGIGLNGLDPAKAEVTAQHEGECPLCGGPIQYSGENRIDDEGGTFLWTCPACGAYGKEAYNRKFAGHIDVDAAE